MIDRQRWNRLSGPLIWLLVGFGVLWLVGSGSLDVREWNPLRAVPPPTTIERVARMRLAFVQGNWQAALSESKALRTDLPDDPERMRIEGSCLLRLGRAKESADVLRRLMDKDSNDMNVRLALALALMQSGSADEARTVLEMLRRHPVATAAIREQAMGLLVRLDGLEPPEEPGSGAVSEDSAAKGPAARDDRAIVDALGGLGAPDGSDGGARRSDSGGVPRDDAGSGADGNSGVEPEGSGGAAAGGTESGGASDLERAGSGSQP